MLRYDQCIQLLLIAQVLEYEIIPHLYKQYSIRFNFTTENLIDILFEYMYHVQDWSKQIPIFFRDVYRFLIMAKDCPYIHRDEIFNKYIKQINYRMHDMYEILLLSTYDILYERGIINCGRMEIIHKHNNIKNHKYYLNIQQIEQSINKYRYIPTNAEIDKIDDFMTPPTIDCQFILFKEHIIKFYKMGTYLSLSLSGSITLLVQKYINFLKKRAYIKYILAITIRAQNSQKKNNKIYTFLTCNKFIKQKNSINIWMGHISAFI